MFAVSRYCLGWVIVVPDPVPVLEEPPEPELPPKNPLFEPEPLVGRPLEPVLPPVIFGWSWSGL